MAVNIARVQTAETIKQILGFLYSQGIYAWRQNTQGIPLPNGTFRAAAKKGIADILGVIPGGLFLAIEVKTGRDRLSLEQEGFLENIRNNDGVTFVVSDYEDFKMQFHDWKQA